MTVIAFDHDRLDVDRLSIEFEHRFAEYEHEPVARPATRKTSTRNEHHD